MDYKYIQIYHSPTPAKWECIEKVDYAVEISELIERIAHEYGAGQYRIDFCDSGGRLSKRRLEIASSPPSQTPVVPKIHVYLAKAYSVAFIRAYSKETPLSMIVEDLKGSFDEGDLYYIHSDDEIYNVARNIHQGILTKLSYQL